MILSSSPYLHVPHVIKHTEVSRLPEFDGVFIFFILEILCDVQLIPNCFFKVARNLLNTSILTIIFHH